MIRKLLHISILATVSVFSIVFLYIALALIFSYLPHQYNRTEPTTGTTIWIYSNGVHIDLVLPTVSPTIDWRNYLPVSNTSVGKGFYPYIGFGWGDLAFYRDTPTWDDLTLSTTLTALFGSGPSAIRTNYLFGMRKSENAVPVKLTNGEYRQITNYILDSFQTDDNGKPILAGNFSYGHRDAFYLAKNSFSPFNTCNSWANAALKSASLPSAIWTPFDFGVLTHYR